MCINDSYITSTNVSTDTSSIQLAENESCAVPSVSVKLGVDGHWGSGVYINEYYEWSIEDSSIVSLENGSLKPVKAGEQVKIVLTEEQKKEVERITNEARDFLKKPPVYATTLVIYADTDFQIFEELKKELQEVIVPEDTPDYEGGEEAEKLNAAKEVIKDFAESYIDWDYAVEYEKQYFWLRFNVHANNLEDFVLTAELRDEVVRFIHALNVIAENLDEVDVPFFVRYEIL